MGDGYESCPFDDEDGGGHWWRVLMAGLIYLCVAVGVMIYCEDQGSWLIQGFDA